MNMMASVQPRDGHGGIIEGLEIIQENPDDDHDDVVDANEPFNEGRKKTPGRKLVFASRTAVFLVILCSTLIVSFVARYFLKNDEQNDFEQQVSEYHTPPRLAMTGTHVDVYS